MMNSNLNLSALPECKFAYQMVNSALLIPCAEYQRVLHLLHRNGIRAVQAVWL